MMLKRGIPKMEKEKQLIDVSVARGYAESLFADPILKMAVNAVLNKTPKVDAVPVVRCGKCIHRAKGTWAKCTGRRADEFCSDGESKDDGRPAV